MKMAKINANPPQNGNVTNHQDQSINSINFKNINNIPSNILIPEIDFIILLLLFLLTFSINLKFLDYRFILDFDTEIVSTI